MVKEDFEDWQQNRSNKNPNLESVVNEGINVSQVQDLKKCNIVLLIQCLAETVSYEHLQLESNIHHLFVAKSSALLIPFGSINLTITSLCSFDKYFTIPTSHSLSYMRTQNEPPEISSTLFG